jgi:GTP cyclohydrolase I
MLSVTYEAFISYKPKLGGKVLGLSKLTRVAQLLGHRPVLQEQLTHDIADVLFKAAEGYNKKPETIHDFAFTSDGSAAHLLGKHSCMSCRGVRENPITATTELRGLMCIDKMKKEFMDSITSIRMAK